MFRLTREVRYAINDLPDDQLDHAPSNSFGGYPSLTGFGQYFRLQVTLEGKLDPQSGYLRNIREIDRAVRERLIARFAEDKSIAATRVFELLDDAWAGSSLHAVTVFLSPFLSITQLRSEMPMQTRLSQKFEFSASHRLHNSALSDEENRRVYGKCNHAGGHGHNYELQVTLRGKPSTNGLLVNVPAFERIVQSDVIMKFDHKNLNSDLPEFKELIPTVENIAMVVYRLLKNRFGALDVDLASVTVWETPKTWCEYSE